MGISSFTQEKNVHVKNQTFSLSCRMSHIIRYTFTNKTVKTWQAGTHRKQQKTEQTLIYSDYLRDFVPYNQQVVCIVYIKDDFSGTPGGDAERLHCG